jgi:hypothetical protein
MSKQTILLLTVAALVVGGIFLFIPKTSGTANQAAVVGIDIFGITKAAKPMPSEHYPAH